MTHSFKPVVDRAEARPHLAEVFAAIRANGQEAVFKTWDNRI